MVERTVSENKKTPYVSKFLKDRGCGGKKTFFKKFSSPHVKTPTKQGRTPDEGSPSSFASKGIHPLLRFGKEKGDFALCGVRQGLRALDCAAF